MSLMRPYNNKLFSLVAYLNNEILHEILVFILIVFLFVNDHGLSILIEFLNEGIHSLHLLDSRSIFFGAFLNLELDLILCEACFELLLDPLLLRSNITAHFPLEIFICLLVDLLNLIITVTVNELQHALIALLGL
jgi:hypothetical protein